MDNPIILSLRNITKTYPGVTALDDFSIDFVKGEVHALLGENGAGKSTLIKVISGAIAPDMGTISLGDNLYNRMTPVISKRLGVEVVYQEFNLVETMTVAENIYLGQNDGHTFNEKALESKAQALIESLGVDLDPAMEVEGLSPAKKQLIEICKCVARRAELIIMDEPSAPLSSSEVEIMFEIITSLKAKGVTIIYISHRLEELFRISDRVSVMRDGRYIDTLKTAETNRMELVSLMVGRELKETYPKRNRPFGEVALEVKNLTGNGDENISFKVHKGEILGIAGLVGAGRTELVNMIYGEVPKESGDILINGKGVNLRSPQDAIKHGMGMIPEDRKHLGCLQEMSIRFNISIAAIKSVCRLIHIQSNKEDALVLQYKEKLSIKTPSIDQEVRNLSGGNQQKVVLAKSLAANPEILIFDEPTRGIDVGAKQEIYLLMNDLAEQGKAILMISSEMEELIGMSDRLLVIHEGRSAGEISKEEFDPKIVIALASGMNKEELVNV